MIAALLAGLVACGDPDAGYDVRIRLGHEVTRDGHAVRCTKDDCDAVPDGLLIGDASVIVRLDPSTTWGEAAVALRALSWARPSVPLAIGEGEPRPWSIPPISFSRGGLAPNAPFAPTTRVTLWARTDGLLRRLDALASFGTPSWIECGSLPSAEEQEACRTAPADAPGQTPLSPWGLCFGPSVPARQLEAWAGLLPRRMAAYRAEEWALVVHPKVEAIGVVAILDAWAAAGLPAASVSMSEEEPPDYGACASGPVDGAALGLMRARAVGARNRPYATGGASTIDTSLLLRMLGGSITPDEVPPPAEIAPGPEEAR